MKMSAQCHQCGKNFSSKYCLDGHLKIHALDREKKFECLIDQCGKKFYTKRNLAGHRSAHSTLKSFQCNFCKANFKGKTSLNFHIVSIHCNEKAYQCDKCEERFCHPTSLKSHSFTHTDEKPHNCRICLKTFKRLRDFRNHVENVHQELSTRKRFVCPLCPKSFLCKYNLPRHIRTHDSAKFPCYFCTKEFTDRAQLQLHTNTHTGEKPFFCSVDPCPYYAAHPNALRRHRQRHHPTPDQATQRIKTCYFCHRKTAVLANHMGLHTLEKPFPCPLCKVAFTNGVALRNHILSHTKEKPFKCTECDLSFAKECLRLTHIARIHWKQKRFFCEFCQYSSYDKQSMINHRVHVHLVAHK